MYPMSSINIFGSSPARFMAAWFLGVGFVFVCVFFFGGRREAFMCRWCAGLSGCAGMSWVNSCRVYRA